MKNIFDYLITADNVLNEEVFDSFANWMFEGDDPSNELARNFLRWSVLYIIKDSGHRSPDNSDFYSFFQGFEKTDLDAFLEHISKYGDIAVEVERTMGSDPVERSTEENQSVYWYFFGTVMEHVENQNLFPEEQQQKSKSNVIKFSKDKAAAPTTSHDENEEGLSEEELKKLSSVFSVIFVVLLVAFFLYNLFIR